MSKASEESDAESGARGPVSATVDEIDGRPHVIIADTGRDDAWIAMPEGDAASLAERR